MISDITRDSRFPDISKIAAKISLFILNSNYRAHKIGQATPLKTISRPVSYTVGGPDADYRRGSKLLFVIGIEETPKHFLDFTVA